MIGEYCSLSCFLVVERSLMWAPLLQIALVLDAIARAGTWRLLGSRRLSQAAMLTNVINNASSYSQVQGSQFRLPPAAPLHCPTVLPLAPSVLPPAPSVLPLAPSLLPPAPSLLPLKRPCSLSSSKTVIPNPKFGVYIIYIYMLER
jgi:hypothetical protein